jgi:cytochrome P450
MTMPYLMQRNEALWGPDAEEFKPDRWLDPETLHKLSANPSIFVPFASGPRNVGHPLPASLGAVCEK